MGTQGDDVIVGTAGSDQIFGLGGKDIICGRGGNDQISGGDGDDNLFGEAGNDTFIWNPGDDNDRIEGSSEIDTLQMNGANVGETFDLSASADHLRFTRNIANVVLDVTGVERVNVEARGGADVFSVNHLAGTGVQKVTFDLEGFDNSNTPDAQPDSLFVFASAGNDQITVSGAGNKLNIAGTVPAIEILNPEVALDTLSIQTLAGNDQISAQGLAAGIIKLAIEGGPGNDILTGSKDSDALVGGEDNDTFIWTAGLPADLFAGDGGVDTLLVKGTAAADKLFVAAGALEVYLSNQSDGVSIVAAVEQVNVEAGRGADQLTVSMLAASVLQKVTLDLRPTATGTVGDGYADTLVVNGTQGPDNISISGSVGSLTISGLAPTIVVQGSERSRDTLTVNAGAETDVLNAQGLAADVVRLIARGGFSNDTITGSAGDDLFLWSPGDGNDVIEGGLGTDTLQFSGSNIGENISLTANGPRLRFTRDIANIALDLNAVERVNVAVVGGADTIALGDLSATNVRQVGIDLAGSIGGVGDGQPDTIQISTLTASPITTTIGAGTMSITWLPVRISITRVEPANDRFVLQTPTDAAPALISSAAEREVAVADQGGTSVAHR
jgi:Ca2+-binding RTX toxin-like protein